MTIQTILYFISILLTCALTGWLAWYAWRQPPLPGVRAYALLAFSECLMALTDVISMLSATQAQALFWFNLRFFFTATIPLIFLAFALDYGGHQGWFSKKLLAGALVIPVMTQILLWSNPLHGLWLKREVAFHQNGPFWIVETSTRIPGPWFLVHSFYSQLFMLTGMVLIFLAAWRMRRQYSGQALLLIAGALVGLAGSIIPTFNLIPQAEFNPFIPGIGISAGLYALAIFRFQFLKRASAQESAARLANLEPQEKRSLAIFILSFILFASGLAAASYLTYQNYEKQFRAQVESQLSAIAALKAEQLQNWRAERLADANLFYQNKNFAGRVQAYLENPQASETQAGLLAYLEKVALFPEYDRVFLLDAQGLERISVPAIPDPDAVPAALVEHAAASLAANEVIFLDFHRHAEKSPIHLSLLVPIFDPQDHRPLGVLVLRIDPLVYLDPFIQRWPVPSASAETLLVRGEGEQVVYLNQLRFGQDTALSLRFPLTETDLPAARAVLGETGSFEGLDYRGQTVITDLRAVPGSPWFLVSKMDTAEVFATLRERLWQTLLFFGVLVLAAGAGLALAWRQQQVRFYRAQVETMQALRTSEEKFRLAFETSPDSVAITRLSDGRFVSVNTGFEQISGYTREAVVGKTSAEVNIWKDLEDRRKVVEGLRANGAVQNYEAPFLTRTGEIYGLMSAVIIELNGEPHILNITRDITERKQVEKALCESEERFREIFNNTNDAIYIWKLGEDGTIARGAEVNDVACKRMGYSKEEFLDLSPADINAGNISKQLPKMIAPLISRGTMFTEVLHRTKDGRLIPVEISSRIVELMGERRIISLARDISERKQIEEALRETNDYLENLFNYANAPIIVWDPQFRITRFNHAFEALTGRSAVEVLGQQLEILFPPAQVGASMEQIKKTLTGERWEVVEISIQNLDGSIRTVLWNSATLFSTDGITPIATIAQGQEITERKRMEIVLQESEERLRLAISAGRMGTWDRNFISGQLNWSLECKAMFGLAPETEMNDERFMEALHPEDRAPTDLAVREALEKQTDFDAEYRAIWPDGTIHWISAHGHGYYNAAGQAIRMTGITFDITERKRAEELLRETNDYLENLFNYANAPIIVWDPQFKITRFNHAFEILTGRSAAEVLGQQLEILFPPAQVGESMEQIKKTLTGERWEVVEISIQHVDGSIRTVMWNSATLFSADEKTPIATIAQGQDITERKRADEALKASELRFRLAAESLTDIIYEWDLKDRVDWFGDIDEIMGYPSGEFPRTLTGWASMLHPEDRQRIQTAIDSQLKGTDPYMVEYRVRNKDGEWRWWEARGIAVRDERGEPYRWIGSISDITEHKQAEEALKKSEKKYRQLHESMMDGFVSVGMDGKFLECNEVYRNMLGYSDTELAQLTYIELTPEKWHSYEAGIVKDQIMARGYSDIYEKEYRRKDGTIFPVELHTVLSRDENGNPANMWAIARDITGRKQAEEILRESERKLREAQKMAHLGFWSWDVKTGEVEWSEEVFKIFGLNPKEFTPQIDSILALSPWPEDHQRDQELINQAIENHAPGSYEQKFLRPDQSIGHYYSTFQGNYNEKGDLISIVGTVLDITERKQAEEALANERNLLHTLIDNLPDTVFVKDVDSRIIMDNIAHQRLLGVTTLGQVVGKTDFDFFPKDFAAQYFADEQQIIQSGEALINQEEPVIDKDGNQRWLLTTKVPLRDLQGAITGIVGINHDITARKQVEVALRTSEERYRSLFENMLNGFAYCQMLFDQGGPRDFIYLDVNQAFETLTGLKDVIGKKVSEVIPGIRESDPGLFEIYGRVALTGLPESFEVYLEALKMWFFVSVYSPQKEYFVTVFDVITERKLAEQELTAYSEGLEARVEERTRELRNAQEQLVRQERLATLGQLAGSIGHELRNPLGVISNAVYYLKMSQPEASPKVQEYLEMIEKETRTSDKIITDLLDFTRIKSLDRRPASVSELISQTLERYPALPPIQVRFEIPADLPQIYADPQHVIQVLGNLVANACQAMTADRSIEQTELTISAAVQGDMMIVAVKDTGPGIPPENMGKLFQPLFTTKTKGIGLGLAVSKKLIEANGGRIEVESAGGQGSTFTVYLPVFKK